MKNSISIVSFCVLMAFGLSTQAQVFRLYGFVQPVNGGAAPEMVNGKMRNEIPSTGSESRYFIYASVNGNLTSQECQLSIHNKDYTCTVEKVSLPVILQSSDPGIFHNDTLIASGHGTFFKLVMQKPLQVFKPDLRLKKLKSANELVLVYNIQNKVYYSVVKHLKVLHPLFTEGAHKN